MSEAPTTSRGSSEPISPAGRAVQKIDYGRRGKGDLFGAFKPTDGEALTAPYAARTTANYVGFWSRWRRGLPRTSNTSMRLWII